MALTPEEEKELAQIDAQLQQPDAETSGLSADEEQELADIEGQLERLDKPRSMEIAARGIAQGVSLGFSDEITGAVESAITDKTYSESRDESRRAYKEAQEANPALYTASEIGGAIATGVATGGSSSAIAGVGAAAGLGMSQADLTEGEFGRAVVDTAQGAALAFAGDRIFKGAGRQLKGLFNRSSKVGKEVLSDVAGEVAENARFREATLKDIFTGKYNTADDYFLSNRAVDRAMQGIDESVGIVDDVVKNEMNVLGKSLKMAKLDVGDIRINASQDFKAFEQGVSELENLMAIDKKAGDYLRREIVDPLKKGLGIEGSKIRVGSMDVEQAHLVKKLVNRLRFSKGDEGILFKDSPEANMLLKDFSDELINKFNSADKTGTLKGINKKFSQLYDLQEVIPSSSDDVVALLSSMSTAKGAVQGRQLITAAHGYNPELSNQLYGVLNPRLKLYSAVSQARGADLGVGTAFRVKAGMGLAGPIGGALSFGKQGMALVTNLITTAQRKAFKFPRSLQGIMANPDLAVSKLSSLSVPAAMQLQQAIDDNDIAAVQDLVTQGLNDPAIAAEFEPGLGFEGKAVTPEDFAVVKKQIKSQGLDLGQESQMMQNFEATGNIPTPEQVPPSNRFIDIYRSSGKGKKNQRY